MLYVTMVLTSNEWSKIKSAAAEYWPSSPLDTQMSRQEASRRLLLSGIDHLRQTAAEERAARVNSYAQSLQPPGDANAIRLPVILVAGPPLVPGPLTTEGADYPG